MAQRGGWGEAGGRLMTEGLYVYILLIHFVVQQKLTEHGKAIILQLKKKKKSGYVDSRFHAILN